MTTQKGKKPVTIKKEKHVDFKESLKKKYDEVFEVVLEGDEFVEEFRSYFRKPTITELGIYFSKLAKNVNDVVSPQDLLLKTIFIGGNDEIFEDGILLMETIEQLQELITGYPIEIEKTAKNNKLMYEIKILDEDIEPVFYVGRPKINDLSKYYADVENNFLVATKNLLKNLWVKGDKSILENDKYFLSTLSAVEKIMERRKGHLEKL